MQNRRFILEDAAGREPGHLGTRRHAHAIGTPAAPRGHPGCDAKRFRAAAGRRDVSWIGDVATVRMGPRWIGTNISERHGDTLTAETDDGPRLPSEPLTPSPYVSVTCRASRPVTPRSLRSSAPLRFPIASPVITGTVANDRHEVEGCQPRAHPLEPSSTC